MSISSSPAARALPIIAIVGMSDRADRPSYDVGRYMQAQGYRIVPVNPMCAGKLILGEQCYDSLASASAALLVSGECISIVDCFRKAADIPPVVEDAINIGASCVWMQLGIEHAQAAERARAAGLIVVMDKCIKIEHAAGHLHGVL
ncbi:CoA-binding protein [Herbaspirillum sp. RTI4]|uniref:CoA-binding protein n=1 Tax=Herbaspirillum sp. RTI4 TaxID=3048640 RepID=UPI002AB33A86|nr:CoA-binding protein [Herbaspirillum sp. RTI4]MDY7576978.1 CoA-binding protein [Herbaspirillum sp. RTI4]MEA9982119.1 CoA-binding protein [Herbaspirillum sp. RTI4]